MKMQTANCGASVKASGGKKVKAAMGGYMKVEKTGYSTGGMAEKQVSRKSDTKDKEMVEASKGGAMKKKKPGAYAKGGTPMKTCAGCPTPKACASAGRCKKSGNGLK